ncbi:MAG: tRNA (guanosine(37)-N1)-methyltransferase TrmD [Firmicutes bacterium]|jgi:tRNA (guanine37-N1)-methyltransferase|nr:tRNA (guanosine(37)-N1)-methyltransferase TrmD [Bacillota bacterium]
MKIEVLTLFPEMFDSVFAQSIIKRAVDEKKVQLIYHNLRGYSLNTHRQVDDYPFGGGAGMLMQIEPFAVFFEKMGYLGENKPYTIYLSPKGQPLKQKHLNDLAEKKNHILLICGHYEGLDQRIIDSFVDAEISIGDYVLTGGEIPAMVLIDGLIRLLPDALGDSESSQKDSFMDGLLEHPHYTRPAEFKGVKVPDVLLSGNHKEIEKWRQKESLRLTYRLRPELLRKKNFDKKERELLKEVLSEESKKRQN